MKYNKEMLTPLVNTSNSYNSLLRKLNLQLTGGNQTYIRKLISKFEIDTSHFTGKSSNKGRTFPPKYSIEEYLSNKRIISSHHLKSRLIKEGFFKNQCDSCGLDEWLGEKLPLELHHKDKNHSNNNLNNLQILCPNCHAIIHKLDRDCHVSDHKTKTKIKEKIRKSQPRINLRKVERPSYETLIEELKQSNYSKVGRKYGVSDNCIRKWIQFYEKSLGFPELAISTH